jgi:hypothetical protein
MAMYVYCIKVGSYGNDIYSDYSFICMVFSLYVENVVVKEGVEKAESVAEVMCFRQTCPISWLVLVAKIDDVCVN